MVYPALDTRQPKGGAAEVGRLGSSGRAHRVELRLSADLPLQKPAHAELALGQARPDARFDWSQQGAQPPAIGHQRDRGPLWGTALVRGGYWQFDHRP